ncbi:MAG: hypothetical protein QM770_14590 [Tepidisphaeraceae bacterium]
MTLRPSSMGKLDDFRIYGAGFSSTAITSIYNAWQVPTVASAANAMPSPVVGGSTNINVLGSSAAGEGTLTYVWSVLGTPLGAVTFDANSTNGAKSTVAHFTASGTYVLRATIIDASGASVVSTVTVQVTIPNQAHVSSAEHRYQTSPNTLRFVLDADVPTQAWSSLIQVTGPSGTVTPTASNYDAASRTLTYTLPADLADGSYHAVLAKGTALIDDYTFNFFASSGDANHDGTVNFADLLTLAANYGVTTGKTFTDGDFNYDGAVNFADLLILAARYGSTVAASPSPAYAASSVAVNDARDDVASDVIA